MSSLSDHRALNSTLRKRCFCWRTLETLFHTKPQPFHFDALFLGTESPSIATTHRLGTSHHWNAVAAPIFAQFLALGPEISWNYHTERPRIFGCLFSLLWGLIAVRTGDAGPNRYSTLLLGRSWRRCRVSPARNPQNLRTRWILMAGLRV